MITYKEIKPFSSLTDYIKCYWYSTAQDKITAPVKNRILPDGCIDIIFNLGNPFLLDEVSRHVGATENSFIVGPMRHPLIINFIGNVKVAGVRFLPGGAFPFLNIPVNEFTDRSISFENLQNHILSAMENHITDFTDVDEIMSWFNRFFMERLHQIHDVDHVVQKGVSAIYSAQGKIKIRSLESFLGVSGRQLERKFKKHTGLTPKMFSRVVRFQNVVKAVKNQPNCDWTDIAYCSGFFDQAHLINEFKLLSGLYPTEYMIDH